MRKIYSLHHTLAMTLHRELEVGEAAISNSNGFKKGAVFDHEGDIVDGMRSGEAIIFHDELLQLSQTLHFKLYHGREVERSNVNGLQIGEAY